MGPQGVMDRTALTLSMENHLPLIVFDIARAGNMARAMQGDEVGTMIETSRETDHE